LKYYNIWHFIINRKNTRKKQQQKLLKIKTLKAKTLPKTICYNVYRPEELPEEILKRKVVTDFKPQRNSSLVGYLLHLMARGNIIHVIYIFFLIRGLQR